MNASVVVVVIIIIIVGHRRGWGQIVNHRSRQSQQASSVAYFERVMLGGLQGRCGGGGSVRRRTRQALQAPRLGLLHGCRGGRHSCIHTFPLDSTLVPLKAAKARDRQKKSEARSSAASSRCCASQDTTRKPLTLQPTKRIVRSSASIRQNTTIARPRTYEPSS